MNADVDALVRYVNGELLHGRGVQVDADTPLFEDGLIDSLNILHLIAFVETRCGHEIPDRDVVMNRFRNVRTIVDSFLS
jgi:acyl carrier protein